jgi:multidrug efflux pump subunit AcrA (membrane-fusion protein)
MSSEKDRIGEWYRGVPLSAKWPIFTGLAILVVWLGCFGVWAGVAPLNSAVVASGTFVATGQNKLIQHFEGGIIREIAVKEGDVVEPNEVLVRMDDTAANAKLRRLVLKKYRLLAMNNSDERIIEAHVKPKDISHVSVGQEALVRLSALNQRITPMVGGSVIYVSADALAEQMQVKTETHADNDTRRDFYVVRVRLDQDDILKRMPEFVPTPGMPADVYIKTGERTFFEYIMKPAFDSFSRAFRET